MWSLAFWGGIWGVLLGATFAGLETAALLLAAAPTAAFAAKAKGKAHHAKPAAAAQASMTPRDSLHAIFAPFGETMAPAPAKHAKKTMRRHKAKAKAKAAPKADAAPKAAAAPKAKGKAAPKKPADKKS